MAEIIYLNKNWMFTEEFSEALLTESVNPKDYTIVSVPATVKETPFNYFDDSVYQMVSGYRKDIVIPDSLAGKSVRLVFAGVAHEATVYINGEERRKHSDGYTAFAIDITKDIEPGKTLSIAVKVDSRETLNQPPFGYVIDYMTYGGIYRDVYLEVSEKIYIKDLFLYAEFMSGENFLCSKVRLQNPERRALIIEQTINGKTFKQEIKGNGGLETQVEEFRFNPGDIKLWDIDNPVLYEVTTRLYNSKRVLLDKRTDKFGFRKSEFKKDGYYLNDRKVKIRGLNRHQSYAYVGYAMPDSMQRLDADILKNRLHVNAVRTSHYPQAQSFIDRCDELGLLVFMEIPGWQHIGDKAWQDKAVENVMEMVMQYKNHPSIILWGVRINESPDNDEFYKRTNEMAKRYDPTRPTGGVRAIKKSHLFEDVYTYNDFVHDGISKGCEKKKAVTSDMNKPYLVTEYNGHMFPTKSFDCEDHRREHAIRHANVLDAIAGENDIAGSFGWCMFDYNTHKDFGAGDRICYHGVLDMFRNSKPAASVYAALEETDDVVLEISSTMDIGEHPGCNRGDTWIFSNADSVKMYKNDKLLKEYFPSDSPYKNLSHGPIKIDDFVGSAVDEGENYSPKFKKELKEVLNAVTFYGLNHLPLRIMWLAAKAVLLHHLTFSDAYALYIKYVGDWGGEATVFKFEAIVDGKVAKTRTYGPTGGVHLVAEADHTDLKEGKTYDVAAISIKALDDYGNVAPFFNEAVQIKSHGDISIIGPDVVNLKGGMGGTYIRTACVKETTDGFVTLFNSQAGEAGIEFTVRREEVAEL